MGMQATMGQGMHDQMGPGMRGQMGPGMMGMGPDDGWQRDHGRASATSMSLFSNHDQIKRTVTNLPDGIRTLTESDDPKVAETIKKHVADMGKRVEEGRDPGLPIESPALHAIFRNNDKIKSTYEVTEKGIVVVQTSTDATRRQSAAGSRRGGNRSCPTWDGCGARGHDEERRRNDGAWHARCHGRPAAPALRLIGARTDIGRGWRRRLFVSSPAVPSSAISCYDFASRIRR